MNATQSFVKKGYGYRRRAKACRYPNAADSRYYWDRLADTMLCTASGVGIVAILFFLITMA